jgi:hypothetical protein
MNRRTVKKGGVKVKRKKNKSNKKPLNKKIKKKGVGQKWRPKPSSPSDQPPARNMAEHVLYEKIKKINTTQSRIIEGAIEQLKDSLDQLELLELSKQLEKL